MKTEEFAAKTHRIEFWREAPAMAPMHQIALHSSKPVTDNQADAEITMPGYQRISVPREIKSWRVNGHRVSNAETLIFPVILSGKATATWLSIGIGGQIRRLLKLETPAQLTMNRRVGFLPGEIEISDE